MRVATLKDFCYKEAEQLGSSLIFLMPWIVLVVVISVVMAVLNAFIAKRKNYTVLGWTLAGLVFSIWSTILLVILPPKEN